MARIEIEAPMEITSRLMAGIRIGEVTVGVEPTGRTGAHGKPEWRYAIDGPDFEHEGEDLSGWDDHRGMLATLLVFLSACGESYGYEMAHPGSEPESLDLFPAEVAEWAYGESDELSIAASELEGEDN